MYISSKNNTFATTQSSFVRIRMYQNVTIYNTLLCEKINSDFHLKKNPKSKEYINLILLKLKTHASKDIIKVKNQPS